MWLNFSTTLPSQSVFLEDTLVNLGYGFTATGHKLVDMHRPGLSKYNDTSNSFCR